jgi:hypothetical protein
VVYLVATSHNKAGHGRSSEGRAHGDAALVQVGLLVPLAPSLGGREHATLAAHVSEGTLAGAAGTTARNTGDTSDGTTSAPGLGGVGHTGLLGDGVGLALVLVHVGVNFVHDVSADGSAVNIGQRDGRARLAALNVENLDSRILLCHFSLPE